MIFFDLFPPAAGRLHAINHERSPLVSHNIYYRGFIHTLSKGYQFEILSNAAVSII